MYVGIDIGTSSVKAVLIDDNQRLIGSAATDLDVSVPRPGWSEQDPEAWWQATECALELLKRAHPKALAATRGIGLSGQMHGAVLLDAAERVLRPAILWNDGRSAAECADLEAGCPRCRAITGNIAMPGFTAPKLLWVEKHEPEVFAKTARVLVPKDYIRLRLSGEPVGEMSDAAGTLWLDVDKRTWSQAMLEATHLTSLHMPRLVEGSAVSAQLRSDLTARYGMSKPPVIAGGGGDNAASACGIGAIRPGQAFLSLGTSGVLFVSTAEFAPNTVGAVHAFCRALPGAWHQMGVILSAAASLTWLATITGSSPEALSRELGPDLTAPGEVTFLPYLSGERTPHNDAGARGVFIGLSHASGRAELTRAVLEGVAFAFADCQRVLAEAGTDIERLTAVGGGARSELWLRILATVLGRPIDIPGDGELGGAFGAARLGLIAATGADPLQVCTAPEMATTIAPARHLQPAFADAHARYRALFPAVKSMLEDR